MQVDVHSHLLPAELPDFAAQFLDRRWPTLRLDTGDRGVILKDDAEYRQVDDTYWSHARRLAFLDRYELDRQVVSPLPVLLPFWAPAHAATEFCRWQNRVIADYVQTQPDRFAGLGTIAFDDSASMPAVRLHGGPRTRTPRRRNRHRVRWCRARR